MRAACLVVLAASALALPGQTIKVSSETVDAADVNARRLWEGQVRVADQRSKVPGMDLTDRRNARHWIGDDTAFCSADICWHHVGGTDLLHGQCFAGRHSALGPLPSIARYRA